MANNTDKYTFKGIKRFEHKNTSKRTIIKNKIRCVENHKMNNNG